MAEKNFVVKKGLTVNSGTILLKEQADAETDAAGYGQLWVNTATPNQLYFTTDAGNDIQLTSGTGFPTLNQSTSGNAATATALANARTIGGVSFDGTGNINLPGVNTAGDQNTTGTAAGLSSTLAVGSGGTGATTLTDGGLLLGSGTNAITALGVLADGEMVVGDGSTDPVAESGATLRTSIGVGTGDAVEFSTVTIASDLIHSGDTNNKIAFGTDTQSFETGGTARINLSDSGLQIGSGARVTTIDTSFNDNDTSLMTSQAIKEKIEAYGYGTGDITGVDLTVTSPITIASETNTTSGSYSATLGLDDPANLSQLTESTDATDDKILLWDETASAWKYMTIDDLQDSIDTTASSGASEISGLSDGETDDQGNVGLGPNALDDITNDALAPYDGGTYNTALGENAGTAVSTGDNNTLIGYKAGEAITTATSNTIVGSLAGDVVTGSYNNIIGHGAAGALTSGHSNIAIGYAALDAADDEDDNIAIGRDALGGSVAGGEKNIAIGNYSGLVLTEGDENVFLGYNAGKTTTTGYQNVAIGAYALENADTGNSNVAIGFEAMECAANSNVDENVAIGKSALKAAADGTSGNVAIGVMSLTAATGDDNTAVGYNSANSITSGQRNVMLGTEAGHALVDDNNNTLIGYQAGDNLTAGDGNVIIGCYTNAASATASGQLSIGTATGINNPFYWMTGDSTGVVDFPNGLTNNGSALLAAGAQTGLTTDYNTARKIGRDTDNLIDFTTDNEITFRVSAGDNVVMKASGEIEATKFDGALEGNADTATALATGRTIGMTGDVVWTSASFDGSGNVTGTATIQTDAVDIAMLSASGTASSSTYLRGDNTWATVSGGGGGDMNDLIDDQTPQLYAGATLDTNSGNIRFDDAHGILDENGAEQLVFQTTGSATKYLQIYNDVNDTATTGTERYSGPLLEAMGDNTHAGLRFTAQGRGMFTFYNETDDANHGPTLNLWRKNAGEADEDAIGEIRFQAQDSDPAATEEYEDARDYVKIKAYITDSAHGSADGRLDINCLTTDSQEVVAQFGTHQDDDNSIGVALHRGQMLDFTGSGSPHALTHGDHAGRYLRATAACTFTLPGTPTKGEQYIIISDHAGTTTIDSGSDTMNGSTTDQTITTRYEAKTFIATSASAWLVIG